MSLPSSQSPNCWICLATDQMKSVNFSGTSDEVNITVIALKGEPGRPGENGLPGYDGWPGEKGN